MTSPESVGEAQKGGSCIQLRVAEAYHKDAGKGVARIGAAAMASLTLENGGVVEIQGKDKLYAIVWPGNPEDADDLIRIDGNTRANLGVGIDSKVAVYRAEARPARKIVMIAPTPGAAIVMPPRPATIGISTASTINSTMMPIARINSGSSTAAMCMARRWTSDDS